MRGELRPDGAAAVALIVSQERIEESMKIFARSVVIAVFIFSAAYPALSAPPQSTPSIAACRQPVILELVPGNDGETLYRIAGKASAGYPLDDLRELLSACKESRPLHVVADYRTPVGQITSAVTSKLQANDVRYFIRWPNQRHTIEIKIVGYDAKLP